jgi:hypothetical protein
VVFRCSRDREPIDHEAPAHSLPDHLPRRRPRLRDRDGDRERRGNVASAARYDDLGLFTSVLRLVQQNYVEEVDQSALIKGAMRGMLAELDPHSSFLDTEAYREMQVDTRGEFHGLGIEITKRKDGFIEVVAPIEGTPAFNAGVRARDSIVSICPTEVPKDWTEPCRSTKNMTLFEAVQLMRGKKGSEIKIEIFRDGFEAPKQFAIRRDVVKIQSVTGRILEPGYAYVRIRAFQEHTVDDLSDVLADLPSRARTRRSAGSCSTCATIRADCSTRRSRSRTCGSPTGWSSTRRAAPRTSARSSAPPTRATSRPIRSRCS